MAIEGYVTKIVWILGHCNIPDNFRADAPTKNVALEAEHQEIDREHKHLLAVHNAGCVATWRN